MSDRPDTRRDNESATSSLAGGLSITLDEPAAEPVSPVGIVFPQENFELRANNPPTSNTNDGRSKSEHWREDPHFIADYLAHNSSKAAAVFRRYDKLAVYRLLLLSRELDGLEKKHNICTSGKIGSQEYAETLEAGGFGNAVGSTVKEYCITLPYIRITQEICSYVFQMTFCWPTVRSYISTPLRNEQWKQSIDMFPPQDPTKVYHGGVTG